MEQSDFLMTHISVLEPTGVLVTGTPSITDSGVLVFWNLVYWYIRPHGPGPYNTYHTHCHSIRTYDMVQEDVSLRASFIIGSTD